MLTLRNVCDCSLSIAIISHLRLFLQGDAWFVGGLPILVKTAAVCHNEGNVDVQDFWRGAIFMRKVLVVIDIQNDFIDGALGTEAAQGMLPRLEAKLAREEALLVFTQDTHGADYLETQEGKNLPVPHCIKPEKGWEIAPSLKPFVEKASAVVEKPTFGSLELPKVIAGLEPDAIELVGLCTDICVIENAMILKAAFPEVPVSVDASCCAGVTPESHENALKAMKMCQVVVR